MLRYFIFSQDKFTLILELSMPLFVIAMLIFHKSILDSDKRQVCWRLLCLMPLALCAIHFGLRHFAGYMKLTWNFYGMLYVAAVIIAFWQFFAKGAVTYRISAVVTVALVTVLCLYNTVMPALSNPVVGNHSKDNYVESFIGITEDMERNYCLNEWKEIDYEFLTDTLLPEVEKAEMEQDEAGYLVALCKYAYYFHDSHVYARAFKNIDSETVVNDVKDRLAGNDYGISMITYTSGETVAVLVDRESEAYASGIHDGTRIVSWDGIPIDEAKEGVECIYYGSEVHSIQENEDKLKAAFLAGKGGNEIEVEYVDENGNIQAIRLQKIGSYRNRLDDFIRRFYYYQLDKENFVVEMLSDTHGYLRIDSESYNTLLDVKAAFCDEHPELTSMLDEKLTSLKEQGMQTLIIDTRNNSGGYNVISAAVASMFTDIGGFNYSFGDYKDGSYILTEKHYYTGDGRWKDLNVIVLTNAACMSAGDQLVNLLSQCPNVTVVGTTCSSGVNQNNGGVCVGTNTQFVVAYPFALTLSEEGVPHIDVDKGRENRVPIDAYIPIDDEYIETVFGEDPIDYELEYILEHYG